MSFRTLGFFDASRFSAQMLLAHVEEFVDSDVVQHHGIKIMWLRKDGEDVVHNLPWKGARNTLVRFANEGAIAFGGVPPQLGDVQLRCILPGGTTDWSIDAPAEPDYAERLFRVHLTLIPSPGFMLYAGGQQVPQMVGAATWIDFNALGSEINLGPVPHYRMIADFLKPEQVHVLN